ncbi:MAG: class I SAM-dependent methyltransferase [Vulcanimicrobiota bacterium]
MAETFDAIAELYDLMVPWESRLAREKSFFQQIFGDTPRRVLDAACGTGRHAVLFSQMGHQVTGTDISANMLKVAEELARGENLSITFAEDDLRHPGGTSAEPFDIITVLGNSLAQFNEHEIEDIFRESAAHLTPGGIFIFQVVNFYREEAMLERFAPLRTSRHRGNEVLFQKFFDFALPEVMLNLIIFIRNGSKWERTIESTVLRAWRYDEMERIALRSGFSSIEFYGTYGCEPFQEKASRDIIGVAHVPMASCQAS